MYDLVESLRSVLGLCRAWRVLMEARMRKRACLAEPCVYAAIRTAVLLWKLSYYHGGYEQAGITSLGAV